MARSLHLRGMQHCLATLALLTQRENQPLTLQIRVATVADSLEVIPISRPYL